MDIVTVLIIVNIMVSAAAPIVIAISELLKRIKRSRCCGSEIEIVEPLRAPSVQAIEPEKKAI